MSEELRECPFCTEKPYRDEQGYVRCVSSDCPMRVLTMHETAWNRRTTAARAGSRNAGDQPIAGIGLEDMDIYENGYLDAVERAFCEAHISSLVRSGARLEICSHEGEVHVVLEGTAPSEADSLVIFSGPDAARLAKEYVEEKNSHAPR